MRNFLTALLATTIAVGAHAQTCPTSVPAPYKLDSKVAIYTGVGRNFTLTKLEVVSPKATNVKQTLPITCLSSAGAIQAVNPVVPILVGSDGNFSLRASIRVKDAARAKGFKPFNQLVNFTLLGPNNSLVYKHTEQGTSFDLFGTRADGTSKLSSEITYQGKKLSIVPGVYNLSIQVVNKSGISFGEIVYKGFILVR